MPACIHRSRPAVERVHRTSLVVDLEDHRLVSSILPPSASVSPTICVSRLSASSSGFAVGKHSTTPGSRHIAAHQA